MKNANTQIATLLVKEPTASAISISAKSGDNQTITVGTSTVAVKVSDSSTTLQIGTATAAGVFTINPATPAARWDNYAIRGVNNNADPVNVVYNSTTGKLT